MQLLHEPYPREQPTEAASKKTGPIPCKTPDEVQAAVKVIANQKVNGPESIPMERWK